MTIFLKKDRWVTPYDLNLTSAFDGKGEDMEALIETHVARRSLTFFVQAWIFHKEKCTISLGKCKWQHGFSSTPYMSAAHSTLLPDLEDNFRNMYKNSKKIRLLWKNEPYLISPICQFYHEMNATILFPSQVNWFDCEIEKVMRGIALKLLNDSSKGEHPYNALKKLILAQKEFHSKKKSHLNDLFERSTRLPPFHEVKHLMIPKERILKTLWRGNHLREYTRRHERDISRQSVPCPPRRQETVKPIERYHPSRFRFRRIPSIV